jgi:hypothetical protein
MLMVPGALDGRGFDSVDNLDDFDLAGLDVGISGKG